MRILNHPIAAAGQRRDKTGRRVARRRVWPRWTRPAAFAAAGIAAAAALGASWMAWKEGWAAHQAAQVAHGLVAAAADAGLAVDEILVEGRLHTPREMILAAVDARRGTPLLAVDPGVVKERLEGLPWVRSAAVERQLPGTIYIRLVERRPMAVWQRRGQLVLIDHQGHELGNEGIEYFPRLPFIVGEDAQRVAADLVAMLAAEPTLQGHVVAAIRVGGRRWNIRLDSGIEIMLPEERAGEAWAEVAALERTHRVLQRQVSVIDLRDPNRINLRRAKDTQGATPGKKDRDA
ncbi:MAG: FtsQ-type POTRA domain-containing protein [Alphaproteobacteria bacterium]|nr:FtsQ-type POTRA domain-containing protein [Alphaproteobacteria bacterium]